MSRRTTTTHRGRRDALGAAGYQARLARRTAAVVAGTGLAFLALSFSSGAASAAEPGEGGRDNTVRESGQGASKAADLTGRVSRTVKTQGQSSPSKSESGSGSKQATSEAEAPREDNVSQSSSAAPADPVEEDTSPHQPTNSEQASSDESTSADDALSVGSANTPDVDAGASSSTGNSSVERDPASAEPTPDDAANAKTRPQSNPETTPASDNAEDAQTRPQHNSESKPQSDRQNPSVERDPASGELNSDDAATAQTHPQSGHGTPSVERVPALSASNWRNPEHAQTRPQGGHETPSVERVPALSASSSSNAEHAQTRPQRDGENPAVETDSASTAPGTALPVPALGTPKRSPVTTASQDHTSEQQPTSPHEVVPPQPAGMGAVSLVCGMAGLSHAGAGNGQRACEGADHAAGRPVEDVVESVETGAPAVTSGVSDATGTLVDSLSRPLGRDNLLTGALKSLQSTVTHVTGTVDNLARPVIDTAGNALTRPPISSHPSASAPVVTESPGDHIAEIAGSGANLGGSDTEGARLPTSVVADPGVTSAPTSLGVVTADTAGITSPNTVAVPAGGGASGIHTTHGGGTGGQSGSAATAVLSTHDLPGGSGVRVTPPDAWTQPGDRTFEPGHSPD